MDALLATRNEALVRLRAGAVTGHESGALSVYEAPDSESPDTAPAERSAKDYRAPQPAAVGGGVNAGRSAATGQGNVGVGVAGASGVGGGVNATGSQNIGIDGASSAGLGADSASASAGADHRTTNGGEDRSTETSAVQGAAGLGGGKIVKGPSASGDVDIPQRDESGDYFEYGDGSVVRATGPDGEVGQVNEKGDIVYGDGTTVVHTGEREITVHRPDGSSSTQRLDENGDWQRVGDDASAGATGSVAGGGPDIPQRDEGGDYFEYGDGSVVRATGPDGEVGQVNDKGDIVYRDGTTVVHTGEREITVHRPDGTSSTQRLDENGDWQRVGDDTSTGATGTMAGGGPDIPQRDEGGDRFEYGDGTIVRATGPDGDIGQVNDKGDIVYRDGTTIVHTGEREITVHRPDGSSVTRRADEGGNWEVVGRTKPTHEGSGSDDKYVSGNGGYGDTDGGDSASDSNDSSGDTSSSDDSGKGGKDSDSSSDADSDGGAEGDSGAGETSESGDDTDTEGDGTEYYADGGTGRGRGGPSDVVQGIVDRVTGQSSEIETGVPQPCSESGGFGVTQPGMGRSGSCIPGHLPTVSEENDEQPDTPDARDAVIGEDARRATTNDIAGSITQPGIDGDGIPVDDLPSGSALDQSPVVNPPPTERR